MMDKKNITISDELLAKYVANNTTPEEEALVEAYIAESEENADEVLDIMTATLLQYKQEENKNKELNDDGKPMLKLKNNWFSFKKAYVRIAASLILAIGIGGVVLLLTRGGGYNAFNDGQSTSAAGMSGGEVHEFAPCTTPYDYTFPKYEAPKEWMWKDGDTLTIRWECDAPLQRFDYCFGYNGRWKKLDVKNCRSMSFDSPKLKDKSVIIWRLYTGCNKDNFDVVYDTIKIIHQN